MQPAQAQLDNRQRRFGLRLLGLPQGDQAKELVGAESDIGRELEAAFGRAGRVEETVLLGTSEALAAATIVEE